MPNESDLRDLFASSDAPNRLDAETIIAKSRARRLPRQLGAAAMGTLAVAGIGVLGIQTLTAQPPMTASTMEQSSEAPATEGMDSAIKRAPAEKLNLCGGTLAEVAPSAYGLQLDVTFPETASAGGVPVEGTVRLTNTSAARVTGWTASSPAITLSQDGIVLWHSNGPTDMSVRVVDLAPGESLDYAASLTPVRCDVEDDLGETFRTDLPAVPAGNYELSAAIDFSPDTAQDPESALGLDLVTGPRSTISLQ